MAVVETPNSELLRTRIGNSTRPGSESSKVEPGKKPRLRRWILSPLGLFLVWAPVAVLLVWEVMTRSLAAYLAEAEPETALKLQSGNPTSALNLAEARLKPFLSNPARSSTEEARSEIRRLAELALRHDPLNARAFGILGQLAQRSANDEQADRFMQASARRSLHESAALYWMLIKSCQKQDFGTATRYADALLRTQPSLAPQVMPMLAKIAEAGDINLQQLLARNPPWREAFFTLLPSNVSDPRAPLDMLLRLKATPNPPSAAELGSYLQFLISRGFHELAYYTWLQFLPPEQLSAAGYLFNGSFESAPSGLPFDWNFIQAPGVSISVAPRTDLDGRHALFMQFGPGRVNLPRIAEMIVLDPGTYLFRGEYKVDIDNDRGLEWRISCADKSTMQIGQSTVMKGTRSGWTDFEFAFTVPETDCHAQSVGLVFNARWESEQFISGSIWFDDLQIARDSVFQP
jgi:hypothetical protein